MSENDWQAALLSIQLASATVVLLLILGTPLAWWLATRRHRFIAIIEALVAMPLILPPTVLGFYLLILFSPESSFGQFWFQLTGESLSFHFSGLLIASLLYSLPFVVQPLQASFQQLDKGLLESAYTLGCNPLTTFFRVVLPICKKAFLTAFTLGFAHTLGEFGVVLMIGGNIPGETQVISIALYDHVESLDYESAHRIAAGLMIFSMIILVTLYSINRSPNNGSQPQGDHR